MTLKVNKSVIIDFRVNVMSRGIETINNLDIIIKKDDF